MFTLEAEFDRVRDLSSNIPYWQAKLWDNPTVDLDTWFLFDAWYRSRSLELPKSGTALVPYLDMVNHSVEPNARFEEMDGAGGVVLRLGPNVQISKGDEVTISYGKDKSQAEMLFSYGFTTDAAKAAQNSLRLQMGPFEDDPLSKAKLMVFGARPFVQLTEVGGKVSWESPFSCLKCVNQEDGLSFKIARQLNEDEELRMFWQDEDVTEAASRLDTTLSDHKLWPLFQLRVVTDIQDRVREQLERIRSAVDLAGVEPGVSRKGCIESASVLRQCETRVLDQAMRDLEIEVRELYLAKGLVLVRLLVG